MLIEFIVGVVLLLYIKYILILLFKQDETIFNEKKKRGFNLDSTALNKMNTEEFKMNTKVLSFKAHEGRVMTGYLLYKGKEEEIKNKPSLIYFQDNSFNHFLIMEFFSVTIDRTNCNIICFPLRGYAGIHGSVSTQTIFQDGEDIVEYTVNQCSDIDSNKIFLFGRGLGSAVALHSCKKYNHVIKGLILENAFTSTMDWLKAEFSYAKFLVNLCIKIKVDNLSLIKDIHIPLLFLVSKDDKTIPYKQSLVLFEAARYSKYKDSLIINFADHGDLYKMAYRSYYNKIKSFYDNCLLENHQSSNVLDLEDNIIISEE